MHPIICKIGPFTVFSYGLMLAAAFLVSASLASHYARKVSIDPAIVYNFSFTAFIAGIIGARLFYVTENLHYYFRYPLEIIMLPNGGLSWFGGLIFGVIFGIGFLRRKKLRIYPFLDLIVPFAALGQAIGRLGCLLNGCCYGLASPYGLYFPVHKSRLIPTQIYSSLSLLLIFIILRLLQGKHRDEGVIFSYYLILYSFQRFIIEFWRADNPVVFMGLSLFQLLSIIAFFAGVTQLIIIRKCLPCRRK